MTPMHDLTPSRIVAELDRYIIGQEAAKRAVAVAIRNRWRRRRLGPGMAGEIYPKNIILIGPTGVGKTEIARRMAQLTGAPFLKIEASKFTEVGYHGRDVESMVRDLLEQGIAMVRAEEAKLVVERAQTAVRERLLDMLLPLGAIERDADDASPSPARQRLAEQLDAGKLESREIELTLSHRPATSAMFANMGLDQMDPEMANVFDRLMPEQVKRRRVSIAEARRILAEQETDKLIDNDKIVAQAIARTEQDGIIFLDEIDKIAAPGGKSNGGGGPDVSRQGVQRDLLPIVEGSAINTRHGIVHTDHILFIAAGAFHIAAVSDLMPELQGRFPVRVELAALGRDEFIRILTEPGNALTKQQQALLAVEGLKVAFDPDAVEAMADLAAQANASLENIGARRLMTIVEKVFEQINFDAPEMVARGQTKMTITAAFVREQVESILKDQDLSKFVL
jgi:ATP-dependent HslUV protease ATP-binding subunit HslU